MAGFIEVVARRYTGDETQSGWQDNSTDDYFVFVSTFATVRLRKRAHYPQTFVTVQGTKLHCGYGREEVGETIALERLTDVPEEVFYDEEFLLVAVDCREQTVVVQRDAFSTVPLFAGQYADVCALSNDFAFVVRAQKQASKIDEVALAEVLLGRETYNRTLAENISLLYDRQRLSWMSAGYRYEFPPNAKRASRDRKESDPKHFARLLEKTIMKYWERYGETGSAALTLSYGLDSSLIAAILADNDIKPLCVTALYPDAYGESLLAKSRDFSARFGVESYLQPIDVTKDFSLPHGNDLAVLRPVFHGSGMYDDVYDKLAEYVASQGEHVVFLGVGGDELCENIPEESRMQFEGAPLGHNSRSAWLTPEFYAHAETLFAGLKQRPQPVPILSYSTASYAPAMNNNFITHDIWPVSPLCDPVLYDYCQRLPHHYRYKKAIMQAYGKARRLPSAILDFEANEDFSPFFDYGVAYNFEQPLRAVLADSVLAQKGYIDTARVLETFQTGAKQLSIRGSEKSDRDLFEAYQVLVTELSLRALARKNR